MLNVRGVGSPLAARRDTNENTFLRNGVKMIFRGGPSVLPGLSVISRVCIVFRCGAGGPGSALTTPSGCSKALTPDPTAPCAQPTQLSCWILPL